MFKSIMFLSAIVTMGYVSNLYMDHYLSSKPLQNTVAAATPEANYKEYCAGCHGEQMNAFVDRKWKHGNSDEDLFKGIKSGYHDEGMPGFDTAFTDVEIRELVDYIKTGIKNVKRYEFADKPTSNIFKTETITIRLDTVLTGLKSPWGMAFLPGGDMLVTDKGGSVYRVGKNSKKDLISGVPEVVAEGQGGLMDVILHPQFSKNGLVYLSYSLGKKTDAGTLATTAVARGKLTGNTLTGVENIFVAEPWSKTRHHYGCRMQFAKDGLLYITVGDRGNEKQNPQSLGSDLGKVHRIQDDGAV
ncbi:MAG: PQQ-dependent sugar dehydrogenase, partial [Chitinophagaceae bacterium]